MRTAALCLALVAALLVLSPAADAQKTALRKCYISSQTLTGVAPNKTAVLPNQRTCFYTCAVITNAIYTWDNVTKECTCYTSNLDGTTPEALIAVPAPTSVYGNVQACFPFCSNAVANCGRCRVNAKGIMCVKNFSRTRCCCTPPSRVSVRKGKIVGCTIDDRMLRESAQDPMTGKTVAWTNLFKSMMPRTP